MTTDPETLPVKKLPYLALFALISSACLGSNTTASTGEPLTGSPSTESSTPRGADTTTTTTPVATTTTSDVPEAGTSLTSPASVGSVVEVGDWRIRVTGVTVDATAGIMEENEFNDPPEEGSQFFMANLEATYVGSESSSFWVDMTLKAVGDSKVAYESFDSYCGAIPDDINDSGETFPGGTITGNVCWRVDEADAENLVMIAEQSFSFTETRQFLSLDPTATPVEASTTLEQDVPKSRDIIDLGDVFTVGGWELKVVEVVPDATSIVMAENDFNEPPEDGHQYFMVGVEATFVGDGSSDFWVDMTLKGLGESNVAYEAWEARCGVIPDDIFDSGETFSGGTIKGNVCWSVDTRDVASLVMIAEESFSFDPTRVFFELTQPGS